MNIKPVAVVTTLYKANLTPDEELSIHHARTILKDYDKYVLVPDNKSYTLNDFIVKKFPAQYFTSAAANAALLFSQEFYSAFKEYDYILIYEIDCLVFSDQMHYWLSKNYDYIGAPWIREYMIKRYDFPDAVGNGGFALRKVDSFLKALQHAQHPWRCITREVKNALHLRQFKGLVPKLFDIWVNVPKRTKLIEDRWWSFKAKNYYPEFSVAPVDEGMRFAFEINPRDCFERIGHQLPFGCHAWTRYDRAFWEPYLLKK